MRVVLIAVGSLFAVGALLVLGQLLAGELFPTYGVVPIRKLTFSIAAIGLPIVVALFFFRWAANLRERHDNR
jgi:hypothetical protein